MLKEKIELFVRENQTELPLFYQKLKIEALAEQRTLSYKIISIPKLQTSRYRVYGFYKPVSKLPVNTTNDAPPE